jgi:hypothetical protein
VRLRRSHRGFPAGSLAELVTFSPGGDAVVIVGHDTTATLRAALLEVVE